MPPNPKLRVSPSGPLWPGEGQGSAIVQFDMVRTEHESEGAGPQILIAGTPVPVEEFPRIGSATPGNRLLVKAQVPLLLIAWDGVPLISIDLQVSYNEGVAWTTIGSLTAQAYPFAINAAGPPAVNASLRPDLFFQAFANVVGPSDSIVARAVISTNNESPAAVIVAEQGAGWIELYELTPAVPAPAP